jgi:regulator of replication initiation timing
MFSMRKRIAELTARLVEFKERTEKLEEENERMRADLAILRETLHTDDPLEIVARVRALEAARQ